MDTDGEKISNFEILKKYLKYKSDGTIVCLSCDGHGKVAVDKMFSYSTIYATPKRTQPCYHCESTGSIGWTDLIMMPQLVKWWIGIALKKWEDDKKWKVNYNTYQTFTVSSSNIYNIWSNSEAKYKSCV